MGKTAFQKIIGEHLLETLPDGNMVLRLDRVWAHEITTPNGIIDALARGCDVVFNPNQIKAMIDHCNPPKDTPSALQAKMMREWSREHGIEFLDVGRNGICHAIIPEKGWILPGQVGIMGDSHTCTHGAMCAFATGVGTTELETGIITGLWICPPQKVIRVNFVGTLPANVYSKDLILSLIKKLGTEGAKNAVLEFGGPVIDGLSMDARMTMSNMAVEAGATSGMVNADDKTWSYLGDLVNPEELQKWNSDPDAEYDQTIEIDVTDMVPVITDNPPPPPLLPTPGQVVTVEELAGQPVNQIYIGSCTNGHIEDLRIAAHLFRFRQVADNVRCIVVPATQHIYDQALEEGLIKVFIDAGCYVSGPTCGACLGMSTGVLAPGETCVSTTNRNFKGRMGAGGIVHLVSPATAVFTAIKGKIAVPPKEDCQMANDSVSARVPSYAIPTHWKDRPYTAPSYTRVLGSIVGSERKDFSGKPFTLLIDGVDTDQLIPAKYLTETDKAEMGRHCLEEVVTSPEERAKLQQARILISGKNFGRGSSREHAPWALEAIGIRCVIARSFERIFEGNMYANGLLCVVPSEEDYNRLLAEAPENISVDVENGFIKWMANEVVDGRNIGSEQRAPFSISWYQKEQIRNGGSVKFMLEIAKDLQAEGKI